MGVRGFLLLECTRGDENPKAVGMDAGWGCCIPEHEARADENTVSATGYSQSGNAGGNDDERGSVHRWGQLLKLKNDSVNGY